MDTRCLVDPSGYSEKEKDSGEGKYNLWYFINKGMTTTSRSTIRKLRRRNVHRKNLCGDKYYGENAYVQLVRRARTAYIYWYWYDDNNYCGPSDAQQWWLLDQMRGLKPESRQKEPHQQDVRMRTRALGLLSSKGRWLMSNASPMNMI